MKTLAFIPARGGSKSIKEKNLRLVRGRTLLDWTYSAARNCKYVSEVFVSSDDPRILAEARKLGFSEEYVRPEYLATDDADVVDAILDALDWLAQRGRYFDAVALLQPTSPLRSLSDLNGAFELFLSETGANTLVSVNRMAEHPNDCLVGSSKSWQYLTLSDKSLRNRQSYENKYYFINGAIYISRVAFVRDNRTLVEECASLVYEMPIERSLDIDVEYHLLLAECLGGLNAG